jgi:hypothetical protein
MKGSTPRIAGCIFFLKNISVEPEAVTRFSLMVFMRIKMIKRKKRDLILSIPLIVVGVETYWENARRTSLKIVVAADVVASEFVL